MPGIQIHASYTPKFEFVAVNIPKQPVVGSRLNNLNNLNFNKNYILEKIKIPNMKFGLISIQLSSYY